MSILALGMVGAALGSPDWLGEIVVLLHGAVVLVTLGRCHHPRIATILGASLVLRISLVFWDLNFSAFFLLPNSGADSEMFFGYAVAVARDPSLVLEDIRGGAFSKMFGILFWVTGVHRIVAQYTNVLLGLSAVLLLDAIMARLPMDETRRYHVLAAAALLPNFLIMSAIFLRESVIAFLVTVSVYFLVRWIRGGSPVNIAAAVLAVLAASTFHAGVIAVGVGYMLFVLFYRRRDGTFGVSLQSFLYLALFGAVILFVVAEYPDTFLGKFEQFDSEDDLLTSTNRRMGGSQYLTGLTVDSYTDLIRVGPLRALYFLGSPMPWDMRGVVDMFTFLTDSLFYLTTPVLFLVVRKRLQRRELALGYALLITIAITSLVFGAGVSNAGTAVRHRFKLMGLFTALLAVSATGVGRKLLPQDRKHRSQRSQGAERRLLHDGGGVDSRAGHSAPANGSISRDDK